MDLNGIGKGLACPASLPSGHNGGGAVPGYSRELEPLADLPRVDRGLGLLPGPRPPRGQGPGV